MAKVWTNVLANKKIMPKVLHLKKACLLCMQKQRHRLISVFVLINSANLLFELEISKL